MRTERMNWTLMEMVDEYAMNYSVSASEGSREYDKNKIHELIEALAPKQDWQFYANEFESRRMWYDRHPNL